MPAAQIERLLRRIAQLERDNAQLRAAVAAEQATDRRYRAILESAIDVAIVAMDVAGRVTEWNSGAERLFGWTADEMRGQPAATFFVPEDCAAERPAIEMQQALATGRGHDERWHLRKDGSRFRAAGEMMPLRGEDSAHLGFLKILRDDTPQRAAGDAQHADDDFLRNVLLSVSRDMAAGRRTEQTLREARGLNTLILNSGRDCTVVLDLEGHTLAVSPGGVEAMEIDDTQAVLGRSWLRVWTGADHDAARSALAAARAGGSGRFQGFSATHKGTPKWWDVVISPLPGPDGEPERLVSVGRDITDLKLTEQRLARSEERLSLALSAAGNVGIWDWDLNTNLIYADKTIAHFFDLDEAAAAAGVAIADLTQRMHPDDVPGVRAALARVFAGEGEYSSQYRLAPVDGKVRWLSGRGRMVLDAQGKPVRFTGASIDITDHQRAESALRLSEDRLASALHVAELGTFDWNTRTDKVMLSERSRQIFGFGPGEAETSADNIFARIHTDDLAHAQTVSTRALQTLSRVEARYQLVLPDGEVRHVKSAGHAVAGADGVPERIVGVFEDVTERVLGEQALRASEAQFRSFAQALPNHVWTSLPDGALDWFNERVYAYSGAAEGTLDGHGWTAIVHADDIAGAGAQWAAALATGRTYEAEFRLRRADGAYRWHITRAVPIHSADGEIERWIGTNTDIEEQRAAREALANLNATLEARVEERTRERDRAWKNSRDLQMVVDADGTIRAANEAWMALLGWRPDEVVGRNHMEFTQPYDADAGKGRLATAATEPLPGYESRVRHKNGSERWISWVAAPEQGLIYASGRHVTAEKQAAADLAAAQEQLRQSQKMEAVGQLTGGVAHDFNNLLQVISGNLHLVAKAAAGNEQLVQRVLNAKAAVRRGAKLSSQLLAFSRRQPLEPKVVNVGRFILGMEDMLRRAIGEAVEIETVVASGLWNTFADPAQIENTVLNLAINARDAMNAHGKLTIEVANATLDDTYTRAHSEATPGQYVMLAVSDTGCGMPPDVVAQVFEPFFTTKPVGSGTGLGLSMVYGFVKQSGGHVNIYSEVGHGTTMKIYLPRVEQREDAVPAVTHEPVTGGTETVLIAEDDEAVRDIVVEMLSDLGYRVFKAADAAGALSVVESGVAVDLLFTDVVMPGNLTVPELARRARERLPRLAVLYTSGYTRNAIVHGGRLDAGVEFLQKPYTREMLARKVRQVLDNRVPPPSAAEALPSSTAS